MHARLLGKLAAQRDLGRGDAPDERPAWKTYAPLAAGAAAGLSTYALARKFRPSAIPELRRLQEAAKNTKFEVATNNPMGRRIRSLLTGARDVPLTSPSDIDNAVKHVPADRTTLFHSGKAVPRNVDYGPTSINTGSLPNLLDDKKIFSEIFTHGTGGAKGNPAAFPTTHPLDALMRKHRGNYKAIKADIGKDFVIKPRTGSMSKAEDLITSDHSPETSERLRNALQNPHAFILQEKVPVAREYRVHTINNVPFTAATRRFENPKLQSLWEKWRGTSTQGSAVIPVMGEKRKRLMDFVRENTKHIGQTDGGNVLGRTENIHQGLDVLELPDGSFKLLESNPTPGTLMNPITARKLQYMVTGRIPRDVAAVGGLGAGAAAAGATALGLRDDAKDDQR